MNAVLEPDVTQMSNAPKKNDAVQKLDSEVIRIARIVAAFRDISAAEYLSELLLPLVQRDLAAHKAAKDVPATGRRKGREA